MSTTTEYTITVFTENVPGLLSDVVSVFTRIKQNIDTLTVSASSIQGIHRFTVAVKCSEKLVQKIVAQLEKKVDIVAAFYYTHDQIVSQEIALYKVPVDLFKDSDRVERLIREHNARILTVTDEYAVLEKTGHEHEVEALYAALKEVGVYEFVRSGRVAVMKPMEMFSRRLREMAEQYAV